MGRLGGRNCCHFFPSLRNGSEGVEKQRCGGAGASAAREGVCVFSFKWEIGGLFYQLMSLKRAWCSSANDNEFKRGSWSLLCFGRQS